jgi:hypothetical protein
VLSEGDDMASLGQRAWEGRMGLSLITARPCLMGGLQLLGEVLPGMQSRRALGLKIILVRLFLK